MMNITKWRRTSTIIVVLWLFTEACHAYALSHIPQEVEIRETQTDHAWNAQKMYGRGVRLGSYFQGAAFFLGFIDLAKNGTQVDPKGQFSGIILALQLLVRWWSRRNAHEISTSELWVGLAQLLLFTVPGVILNYLSFFYQRLTWRDVHGNKIMRRELVRGQGFNFMQTLLVIAWVATTNIWFARRVIYEYGGSDYVGYAKPTNPLWMFGVLSANSASIKSFMTIEIIVLTSLELGPFFWYVFAWIASVKDYWGARAAAGRGELWPHHDREDVGFPLPERLREGHQYWVAVPPAICAIAAFIYEGVLIASIQQSIKYAELDADEDVLSLGQLLLLIIGPVALASALFHLGGPRSDTTQRVERYKDGKARVYNSRM